MRGLIGKKDVLLHPLTVIRGFGWRVLLQTLVAARGRTFLEIISEGIPHPATPREIELSLQMDTLVSFEIRGAHIYARMADLFQKMREVRQFFLTLSGQEEGHAEILRITKVELARRQLWQTLVPIKLGLFEKIDRELAEVEEGLRYPQKMELKEALTAVEKLEASEINIVFDFLLHSVHTPFLKKIYYMIPSLADHQTYLNTLIPLFKQEILHKEHLNRGPKL